ncbi:hypothetical protein SAMN05443543_10721 [Flavobacterium flevense]|nr:hypothetical protein SAMN05443543_10721 [Flavobacterium flevense]
MYNLYYFNNTNIPINFVPTKKDTTYEKDIYY